jgi:hypothetical protein
MIIRHLHVCATIYTTCNNTIHDTTQAPSSNLPRVSQRAIKDNLSKAAADANLSWCIYQAIYAAASRVLLNNLMNATHPPGPMSIIIISAFKICCLSRAKIECIN